MAFRRRVTLLGDSQTQGGFDSGAYGGPSGGAGWVSMLSHSYIRKADVINRGFSGYNSRHGVALLPYVFPAGCETSLLTTVFLGTNDAASCPKQFVDEVEYEANMVKILTRAAECSSVVIAIAPGVLDTSTWPDRSNPVARAYGKRLEAAVAAASAAVPGSTILFFDLFEAMGGAAALAEGAAAAAAAAGADGAAPTGGAAATTTITTTTTDTTTAAATSAVDWRSMLCDGLHFSPAGQRVLFDGLVALLGAKAPHVLPEALTIDFPRWNDAGMGEVGLPAFEGSALAALHAVAQSLQCE